MTREIRGIGLGGPATSGKSTIACLLEGQCGWNRIEGDDYHDAAWKEKPHPLSPEERRSWMLRLVPAIREATLHHPMTVATCSALTPEVRQQLLDVQGLVLVYLRITVETALRRAAGREHWFNDPELVRENVRLFQPPPSGERVFVLDGEEPPQQIVRRIVALTNKLAAKECAT